MPTSQEGAAWLRVACVRFYALPVHGQVVPATNDAMLDLCLMPSCQPSAACIAVASQPVLQLPLLSGPRNVLRIHYGSPYSPQFVLNAR